jgi:hypothetical protein
VQAKDGGFVTVGWSRSNAFMINRNKVARIGLLNLKYTNVSIFKLICKGNPLQLACNWWNKLFMD